MDEEQLTERIYEQTEQAWKAAADSWCRIYEMAMKAPETTLWAIEEGSWTAYIAATEARRLAWRQYERATVRARDRGRKQALETAGATSDQAPKAAISAGLPPLRRPVDTVEPTLPPGVRVLPRERPGPNMAGASRS